MGRNKKVTDGRARTTFLREGQIAGLQARADALGVDFSDAARGLLDLILPVGPTPSPPAGPRAAFELLWRRLDRAGLGPTLAAALATGQIAVPVERKVAAADHDRLRRAVEMARRLSPPAPDAAPDPEMRAVRRWAAAAPDDLLVLLACPAVLAWEGEPGVDDDRPTVAVVPLGLDVKPGESTALAAEAGYELVAKTLKTLSSGSQPGPPAGPDGRRTTVRVRVTESGWPARLPCRPYRIVWEAGDPDEDAESEE